MPLYLRKSYVVFYCLHLILHRCFTSNFHKCQRILLKRYVCVALIPGRSHVKQINYYVFFVLNLFLEYEISCEF